MKRFIVAFLAYIAMFIGSASVVLALMSLDVLRGGDLDFLFFFGGAAVIAFITSWLLLEISRKK